MIMYFRKLLSILLLAGCSLSALPSPKDDLVGIWQLVVLDNEGDPVFVPSFKEFYQDGRFSIIRQTKSNKPFRIMQAGTYKLVNDSTMREHIDTSLFTKDLIGQNNDLGISFSKDKKYLFCTFFIPGNPKKMQELWIRVDMPEVNKDALPSNFREM